MGKHSLASIAKSVRTAMKKHSPEILTGIGIFRLEDTLQKLAFTSMKMQPKVVNE